MGGFAIRRPESTPIRVIKVGVDPRTPHICFIDPVFAGDHDFAVYFGARLPVFGLSQKMTIKLG